MSAIEWNDSYSVGIPEFDNHHKYLLELLNKLFDDFTGGVSREDIGSILDELVEYASYHFSAEESWMKQNSYPDLRRHKDEHDGFAAKAYEMLSEYNNGRFDLTEEVLAFLNSWLTNHILGSDAEYGRYNKSLISEAAKKGRFTFVPSALRSFMKARHNYPLHIHISTLLLILLLLVGSLIGGFGYNLSLKTLEVTAADLMQRISRETLGELRRTMAPAEMAVNLLSHSDLADSSTWEERWRRIGLLREALDNSSALSSIYVGYASGDFFFVRRVFDESERISFKAPESTRYIVQSIERGDDPAASPRGRFVFLDATLNVLREDDRPDYAAGYDPRGRGWFKDALAATSQIKTEPYLFFSNRKVGATLATRSRNGRSVVAADILLDTLSFGLARQKVTENTLTALVNSQGFVIAHEDVQKLVTIPEGRDVKPSLRRLEDFGVPVMDRISDALRTMTPDGTFNQQIELPDGDWRVSINPVVLEGAHPLYLLTAIPDRELFAEAVMLRSAAILITLLTIALAIPLTWILAGVVSKPLRKLVDESESIRRFDFSEKIRVRSIVKEVNQLGENMDEMKRTIRRFLSISAAVAAEEDFDHLLPMLLTETLSAADADAGVLYLVDDKMLVPVALRRGDGLKIRAPLPRAPLDGTGPLLAAALRGGKPRAGELDADDARATGLTGVTAMLEARHGLAVPLLNRHQQLVGAMLLVRKAPIEEAQVSFVTALSASAATSLETRELLKLQKELFEAFIQLIANAIDAKSPYTGGHCARVPELAGMLARAACAESTGPFKDFHLSEQEWDAVYVASWLHDCGKVTTPEYVVDKATKLETIHDRIHEVRTRFEVLKRDAEIACLKAIAGGEDETIARERLAAEQELLDSDFAFVAACNEGGEFMSPEKLERLKAIASRTWLRTLDDRIGISHEEKGRKALEPAAPLPAVEPLLADKPEHRLPRSPQDRVPPDNKWGFRMPVPELLYNKGEVYNLSIGRGTLTEEERYKICEHIVQTLVMLSQLPYPKHLRQVPEIACGHHERMDGTGYPKCLTREEMSPLARLMSVADIFEALTAVDRPYKKGKTLSEAIKIMSFMKKDRHIDPDWFDLFLRSGVYREYAEKFMKPEQIDHVDIEGYLSARA